METTNEPITRWEQAGTRLLPDLLNRWQELSRRDFDARMDSANHSPLTTPERIEMLAVGAAIAHQVQHPAFVHDAVKAGLTFAVIGAAVGRNEEQVREAYREWAEGQHQLYRNDREVRHPDDARKLGLDDDEYAQAIEAAQR